VVKLGHPHGFRKDRPAPVRLGRVLGSVPDAFATDCPIVPGDSGGPFFDLDRRLVGILNLNDAGVVCHLNRIPAAEAIDWDVVQDSWTAVASPRIATLIDSMKKGEILRGGGLLPDTGLARADRLAPEQWTQGKRLKGILEPMTQSQQAGVVSILNGGTPVALGTVVDQDGLAVVMASALPPRPRCRLPDGSIAELTIAGVDKSFDLAVVRVSPKSIRPVQWADRDSLPAGMVVAAAGPDGQPLTVGVVSVATRKLADAEIPTYELPLRVKVDSSWVFGKPSKSGSGFAVLMAYGLAKVVGVKPGDRLVSVAGHPIAAEGDVATAISEKRSGDVVSVVLDRDGKTMTLELPLLPEVSINATNATWRSDDYPIALEYSPPVRTTECGGPLVDLSGRVVGITVGRANTHAGWAIPADSVRRVLEDAKAGKLMAWPAR
jgi:S1-C subfamily serine protease